MGQKLLQHPSDRVGKDTYIVGQSGGTRFETDDPHSEGPVEVQSLLLFLRRQPIDQLQKGQVTDLELRSDGLNQGMPLLIQLLKALGDIL
jgi:hypothetical protein